MKCTTCGSELEPGAAFCVRCGTLAPESTTAGMQTTQLREPQVPQMHLPHGSGEIVPATSWSGPTNVGAPRNALAIVSLVCGILGVLQVLPVIGPIAAVITGHLARRQILNAGSGEAGAGMALAGLIMGYAMLVIYLFLCVLGLVFAALFTRYFS